MLVSNHKSTLLYFGLFCFGAVFLSGNVLSQSVSQHSVIGSANNTLHKAIDIKNAPIEEVIVTANRLQSPWGRAISQVASVGKQEIETVNAVHVNQIASRVAGVWVSRGNGQEHLTAIRSPVLTGAGGCGAFFIAQDGISLRAPAFCNANQLFDANTLQAKRIDILNGTASTLYGSNAVHGVINIVTPYIEHLPQAQIAIEGGPNDFYRTAFTLTGTPHAKKINKTHSQRRHHLATYGELTADGGYKDNSGYDQQKINIQHEYGHQGFSIKNHIALTNLNQETAGFVQGLNAFSAPALKKQNPNPEAYRDAKSFRAYSIITQQKKHGQLTLKPYLRYNKMEFLQHFLPWQAIEKNSHKSIGLQSDYMFNMGRVLVNIGADADITQGELSELQPNDFSPSIPQGAHYDYTVNTSTVSPFVRAKWQVNNALSLHSGIRFDTVEFDYHNHLANGDACEPNVENCRFTRPADTHIRFNYASTQLGFNYRIHHASQIFGRVANGFRAPQATELFRLQAGQTSTDLNPEEATTYELGIRGGGHISYQAVLFNLLKRDVLFQDANRNNINGGQTEHAGIELSTRVPLNAQWSVNFNGTYAKHIYKSDFLIARMSIINNDIDTAPRKIGSIQLAWKGKKVRAEADFIKQGEYFLNPTNTSRYNGHSLLNIRAQYTIHPQMSVNVRLINALNKDYAERADFGFGNYRYFVGEPRSVFFAAKYTFK